MMLQTFSLASSPNSAMVRVDKATSEFLLAPDWTMNMEICDAVNSDPWTSKDVIKQVKKRLLHKNPRIQLLSLTLLETIVKNCGEHIHLQIAERKILDEMVKLAKKKGDMQVRDKVLVLLDNWQEAFGGPGGKHSQYYWAYDELRRSGVPFPPRSFNSVPIITPPATQPPVWQPSPGFGMPSNSSRRLDEGMASEVGSLSFSTLESMRNVMELLADMLQAVNPNDRLAMRDEVIIDLVDGCRTNQKKLIQMLSNVVDEVLLAQGIELNDALQGVLAKHDAIASGSPLPARMLRNDSISSSSSKFKFTADTSRDNSASTFNVSSYLPSSQATTKGPIIEEEEEDPFAQLAKRHSKRTKVPADAASSSSSSNAPVVSASDVSVSSPSNALVLCDPPVPVSTNASKEQDMVDLLSIVLSSSFTSEETQQQTPKAAPAVVTSQATITATENMQQQPSFNTYVAPWAQQPESRPQPQMESPVYSQDLSQQQQMQHQTHQPLQQPGYYSLGYPPPPWAATPGYLSGGYPPSTHGAYNNSFVDPRFRSSSFQTPLQQSGTQQQHLNSQAGVSPTSAQSTGNMSLQNSNSFQNPQPSTNTLPSNEAQGMLQRGNSLPSGGSNGGVAMNGTSITSPTTTSPISQKPAFIPHYRLFEDLNVFGSSEGKMRSGPYSSASGNSSQNMVGGRR